MNSRFTRRLIFSGFFLFLLLALHAQDTTLIKVIVTTDIHGNILPYDVLEGRKRSNSMAHIHSFVELERTKENHHLILLDNGDLLQGDPLIYYYNFIDTTGIHPMARVMNFMGYDAATIGNHDIEAGHPVYDKLAEQFNFPWLGGNIIDESNNLPYFRPYTIIERSGARIAVFGLCTPSVPKWLPQELWSGLVFEDMVKAAQFWAGYIQKYEKPDLLIGLFHSGAPIEEFPDGIPEMLENASRVIASQVPGFDIVFTGHDHRRWNEFVPNVTEGYTLLLGGGSNARNVAVAEIIIISDPASQTSSKEIKGNVIDIHTLPAAKSFLEEFEYLLEPVKEFINQPVTYLPDDLSSKYALFGSAPFVNLIHHIQLDITGADISFAAPLSFNALIPAGNINRGDIFKLYRFENQLYTLQLSGQEIKDFLYYSYGNWMNHMQNSQDHLINFVRDENGKVLIDPYGRAQTATPFFNFESAAGIIYSVDVSKPAGEKIQIKSLINGKTFHPDSTYTVAINSYRASGGGGHLTAGAKIPNELLSARISWTSGQDLRYMIVNWLTENGYPGSFPNVNWTVIPEKWHAKGMEKDMLLLFPK